LGGYIAHHEAPWLQDMKVATPRGLIPTARRLPGIVTSATVRVRALPTVSEQRQYLFPDFAAGLAALHEAERQGIGLSDVRLSDAAQTRFDSKMTGAQKGLLQRLEDIYRQVRRLDDQASALFVTFTGSDTSLHRKRFDALAARLGALVRELPPAEEDSEALMDRGVTVDSIQAFATWSRLPVLYATARAALDEAMRKHSPRAGAHGLVMAQVGSVSADGANLRLTMIFPRVLGDGVAQAQAIRDVAETAFAGLPPALLETQLDQAIRQVLDPKGILP
jgi:alkyldihydroxyacetonephosphate synthase